MPFSIFARNSSRSIASSIEAFLGSLQTVCRTICFVVMTSLYYHVRTRTKSSGDWTNDTPIHSACCDTAKARCRRLAAVGISAESLDSGTLIPEPERTVPPASTWPANPIRGSGFHLELDQTVREIHRLARAKRLKQLPVPYRQIGRLINLGGQNHVRAPMHPDAREVGPSHPPNVGALGLPMRSEVKAESSLPHSVRKGEIMSIDTVPLMSDPVSSTWNLITRISLPKAGGVYRLTTRVSRRR